MWRLDFKISRLVSSWQQVSLQYIFFHYHQSPCLTRLTNWMSIHIPYPPTPKHYLLYVVSILPLFKFFALFLPCRLLEVGAELFPLLHKYTTPQESVVGMSIGFPAALLFIYGVEYLVDTLSGDESEAGTKASHVMISFDTCLFSFSPSRSKSSLFYYYFPTLHFTTLHV